MDGGQEMVIGAPGEDVGSRTNAGSSLSLSFGSTDFQQPSHVRVLVGVPLEDLGAGAGTDAGMVLSRRPEIKDAGRFLVDGRAEAALTFSGGPVAATRYGQVLSSSFLD